MKRHYKRKFTPKFKEGVESKNLLTPSGSYVKKKFLEIDLKNLPIDLQKKKTCYYLNDWDEIILYLI